MAIKYTKTYTSEAEYMYDLARSSELFRGDAYDYAVSQGQGEDYAYALAGTKTKEAENFILQDYNILSGQDQYMYLLNEYYVDKSEMAIDEETGEKYNVYERNKEYLDYKIQEAIDLQTYESLNDFERFFATIGGYLGNALNELFLGTIEGLVDLGAVLVGQKDWAATDFTGVQANREALQRYARAYTYIDKNWFAGTINDVVTGIAKMAPLAIPYAGPWIYFGAMAGNTAEAAIRANPDIDYGSLVLYTAGVTALEFVVEKFSGKIFGSGKLIGGAKSGNFFTRFALDFASEGFEEAVAEIGGSLLYTAMVDNNAPIASFSDIMYAGLIGGLIGGIATTGRVAGTRSQTILQDGSVIDTKLAKLTNQEGTKLSKTKSLFLQESIAEAKQMLSENAVTDLQAKYSSETLEQIKTNHAEEYTKAVQEQQEQQNKFIKSTMGLSKILETIGPEGFQKAVNLLDYSMEQQAKLISNFVAKTTGTTATNRAIEEKFNRLAGGKSSFTISDALNSTQQKIKDGIKKLYGKDVFFGNIGEQDGVMKRHGLTLDENTIVLDINLTQNESIDTIMNKVVKEELVHALQFQSGILDAKTLYDLMEQYKKLGGEMTTTELDASYAASSDISKISEAQAKALAQTLLFDDFTVTRIFNTNRTLFNKIYNWLKIRKEKIELLKENKTNKDKVTYKQLLKCMKTYKDSVAEQIGNEQDANTAKAEMNLSDEELLTLLATYLPDNTNEHYTLLSAEYTIHTQQRMAAEKLLSRARADINKTLPFSYKHVFDPTYYGVIKASDGTEINFVEQIMARNPEQDFRYNLQEYMINECGFAINEKEGCLMEVVDYNKVTTQDFDTTCAELQTNPNALNKYTNLSQIFNQRFNEKFVDERGVNQLEEIDLKIVAREGDAPLQAQYGLSLDTNKPTITVYIKEGQTMYLSQIDNLKHKIFHETTHALADIQGLQNGTSTNYVLSALKESADRKKINKLAKLLLTDEFYAENKNNTEVLMTNIAYGIYRITDGEYAAEAYASSLTRKGDMKVNLKAGATMNRSGFRTDGLYIYGYGRFKGIELQATTIVRAKQQYKASALRNAIEVVAYAKESGLNNFLAGKGVVDLEKAGFSYEVRDALETETLTEQDLLDLFNRNEIGTPEATNIIIEWLTRNNPNKNVKTIEDINQIKKDGLINAMTYNKIRQKNDPQYNKSESHTYEEVKSFIDKNPNAQVTVKTKDGSKNVSAIKYKFKQFDKIESYLTVENSKANQIILESDFDYSVNRTEQLVKDLRNNKITQDRQEFAALDAKTADTEDKDYSALDKIAAESYVDVIESGELDRVETETKESSESKLTRISNEAKKNLSEWLTTSGRSGKAYEIKEALLQYSRNIKETETELSFNDIVSKEDFEDIISSIITEENWQTISTKIRNNKVFIDTLFGDGTSLDLRTQIKNEFSKTQETKAEKLRDIAKGVSKESNIKSKAVVQESVAETTKTLTRAKPETETLKKDIEKTLEQSSIILSEDGEAVSTEQVRKVDDSISVLTVTESLKNKVEELKNRLPELSDSEYTGDYNNATYIKTRKKWFEVNSKFLESITPDELPKLISVLRLDMLDPKSSAGSNILLRYAYDKRHSQFKSISDWIKQAHQRRTTEAAQTMGNANALYGKHDVKDFVSELQSKVGQQFEFDSTFTDYAIKSFTGKDMSMDDFTNTINEQLKALNAQFEQSEDPVEGMELEDKIEKTSNLLDAINSNNVPAMVDAMNDIQQNEDTNIDEALVAVDERTKKMIEYLSRHIEEKNGTWVFTKEKSILSDKLKQKLSTFLAGMNSFRYMMMLSNPKTGLKNAISNTLSATQAIAEDAIGGFYERRKWLKHDDTQVSYHGQYNEEFKNYVKKKYLPFIKKATEGDKYTSTESEKLRNEFAVENDPIRKIKVLRKIKELEAKMLNDEKWTQPRALRNLTRTLAGSHNLIYTQCWDTLVAKYRGKIDATKITSEELAANIEKKNGALSALFAKAAKGDLLARLQLAEKLKLDIVSTDPSVENSIFNHSIYRANKLFLKIDNWMNKAISRARRKGGAVGKAVAGTISLVMPFARMSVNSTMYMLDRSPVGLARSIIKLCQIKTAYRSDMVSGIEDYYKAEYSKLLLTERDKYIKQQQEKNTDYYFEKDNKIKEFDYSENKFNEWAKKNVPQQIQKAIKNTRDTNALQTIYKSLVEQGKIPPHAIGAENPFMRAQAMELLAQGSLGTATMAIGFLLAALTDAFDYDDDDDYLGPVIKLGNFKMALDDLSPFGSVFVVGAMLGSDNTDSRFLSAFKVFVDGSILSTMDSSLAYSDSVLDFFKNQFVNTIQQFQPAITKNLAKTVYNAKKDKSGNLFWNTLKTLGSNSLIFNWLVPNKINPYTGEPERYYESGLIESLFGIILPVNIRIENKSELEKIAESLGAETTGLTGRFTINDKSYTVTGAEKEKLAQYRANYIQTQYSKISSGREKVTVENEKGVRITTTWDKLTNTQKKTVMERIYSDASSKAKIKHWIDSGNIYRTSNQNEFNELKKLFKSGVEYRSNWSKSKFIER